MNIDFTIFKSNTQWSARAHQLNSDFLLRNVLTHGHVADLNLQFAYDESTHTGLITNLDNQVIGDFTVRF
ncbi:hypothetical protein [Vibrio paucivorans]|uniref:Uncharacterized protein n=1 Tax=Vibrio paucivorans TaxID=2829489 RepID=A0A9X3HUF1_9VIBR|nr:hypothetical protein [Vibrio paucivorans]MCW8336042.1 hypothetical protein [Vibrio paucivorans]